MVAHSVQRLGMQQLLAACLAGLLRAAVGAKADLDSVQNMLDVYLGFDNVSGFDTTADVYCSTAVTDPCQVSSAGQAGSPVVLVYPGFSGGKEEYSAFATILAESGYYVLVLEQLVAPVIPVPPEFEVPEEPSNIVRPTATAVALDWLNDSYEEELSRGFGGDGGYGGESMMSACMPPDTNNVLLVGHSYGATAVKDTLEADLAIDFDVYGFLPVPLPVYPEIKGAFLFGLGPLNAQQEPALPDRRILVATGDLDFNALNYTTSDNESYLILENIDHFSIADSYFIEPRLSGKTNRTFAEAQAVVGEVGIAALNSMHCDTAGDMPNADLALPEYVVDAFGVEDWLEDWISWLPV